MENARFQFKMRVQPNQGSGADNDDTALNSICLVCNNGMEVCSKQGTLGTWGSSTENTDGFSAADFLMERHQDDSAGGVNMKLYKHGSSGYTAYAISGVTVPTWGVWRGMQYCRKGAKICAIQTRVQDPLSSGDDVALSGVKLFCCSNVKSVKVHLDAMYEVEGNSGSHSYYTETRQITTGLVSSSQIDETTSFGVAASLSASVGWGAFSGSVGLETSYAKSAFSSALTNRKEQTTSTTSWKVKFSDPLYVYQGRTTVYMSDGGSFELAGDIIQQSDSKLDVTNIEVLT